MAKTVDTFVPISGHVPLGTLFRGFTAILLALERQYVLFVMFLFLWGFLALPTMKMRHAGGLSFAVLATILWACTNLDQIQDLVLLFVFMVPISMACILVIIRFFIQGGFTSINEGSDYFVADFAAIYSFFLFIAELYFYLSPANSVLLFDRHTVSWGKRWDTPSLASFVLQYMVLFFKENEKKSLPFEFVPVEDPAEGEEEALVEHDDREVSYRVKIKLPCIMF